MEVKLVSITQSLVPGIDTAEQLITYCARVSNPNNQLNTATAPKLLNHCIKHGHWSVFEMANMCIELKTSRAIAAQILRHNSFRFQEFSQRYSTTTKMEPIELRKQAISNRQSSTDIVNDEYLIRQIEYVQNHCIQVYEELINHGIAREVARFVLPLNTQTTLYMNGSVRSWIHYLMQRTSAHTQKEHQQLALLVEDIFKGQFPEISKALNNEI
jgi:thymidylate synthase (FAD)